MSVELVIYGKRKIKVCSGPRFTFQHLLQGLDQPQVLPGECYNVLSRHLVCRLRNTAIFIRTSHLRPASIFGGDKQNVNNKILSERVIENISECSVAAT